MNSELSSQLCTAKQQAGLRSTWCTGATQGHRGCCTCSHLEASLCTVRKILSCRLSAGAAVHQVMAQQTSMITGKTGQPIWCIIRSLRRMGSLQRGCDQCYNAVRGAQLLAASQNV